MTKEIREMYTPNPKQLQQLSSHIMGEASDRNRLRKMARQGKACFFVDETEYIQIQDEDLHSIRHRLAARVAKQTIEVPRHNIFAEKYEVGIPEWRMQLYDTYWYGADDARIGARSLYRFVWNNNEVLRAERATAVCPGRLPRSLDDELEYIDGMSGINSELLKSDFVDLLHAENEYQTLTAGDVDMLDNSVGEYFRIATR